MMRHLMLVGTMVFLGCTGRSPASSSSSDASIPDAATIQQPDAAMIVIDAGSLPDAAMTTPDANQPDAAVVAEMDAGSLPDAAMPDAATTTPDAGNDLRPWRDSFSTCWNLVSCRRAMILSHGGDWNNQVPYGSHTAHVRAFENGADAVKVDVRVTMDGVPMVVHSSPFEFYETLNCGGQKIEEMTAADVAGCHMFPSTTETFPRLDDEINWARGKINLMFTVKETTDFPAAMALALSLQATDFVLMEVAMQDITTNLPPITGWDQFFYDVQLDSLAQLNEFVALPPPSGVLMVALDLNEFTEPRADISQAITDVVLPHGLHALTPSDKLVATVDDQLQRFNLGFDIVYSYNLTNGVMARTTTNMMRGISPPMTTLQNVVTGMLPAVLKLNNAAVPNVNALNLQELQWFAETATYFRVALDDDGKLLGFLIALGPGSSYTSPNYRWFQERHDQFLYIDRVVVEPAKRKHGVGGMLYADVEEVCRKSAPVLTCEVNLRPANEASMQFHLKRGFKQAATQDTESGAKTVALLVKRVKP